ncbi:unnamed protein product [Rotaria magnacalcarata]|uniref:RING-type domain-containing protein n=1 Tax=Rotaria magnacalcarata TaxID=392030 RepID=A0A816NXV6_9BILA|nr:unnamed protein product [Rotaria magnacalcarata]CAF4093067.1 unnamed protein product [Rotaria magnacalcarata]
MKEVLRSSLRNILQSNGWAKVEAIVSGGDIDEPPLKKHRTITDDRSRSLEDRIRPILSCCKKDKQQLSIIDDVETDNIQSLQKTTDLKTNNTTSIKLLNGQRLSQHEQKQDSSIVKQLNSIQNIWWGSVETLIAEVLRSSLSNMIESNGSTKADEAVSDSVETTISLVNFTGNDIEEPPLKKLRTIADDRSRSLEDRIRPILSCCICLDLSTLSLFQCPNGHLMCSACLHHLIADCMLKDQENACPNCRCKISKMNCTRNLAVEKIISELPTTCAYCTHTCPRGEIKYHESETCPERPTVCEYSLLGCDWVGPSHCLTSHVTTCEYPKKTGQQLLDTIRIRKQEYDAEKTYLETALDLLLTHEIDANDISLTPMHTDDFSAKLYFETSPFKALECEWKLRVCINDHTSHPHTTSTRWLSYQLVLASNISETIKLKFFISKGPYSNLPALKFQPIISHFEFNENNTETEYVNLPISSQECNQILSSSSMKFRFWIIREMSTASL